MFVFPFFPLFPLSALLPMRDRERARAPLRDRYTGSGGGLFRNGTDVTTATFHGSDQGPTGPTGQSGFSRRSYHHVNDGTAAASWLVIGFRLPAPPHRPRRPPSLAAAAGDIDISL